MSALDAERGKVGRGLSVHAFLPGQASYMRETVCGYMYPIGRITPMTAPVTCKHCLRERGQS